MRKFDCLSLDSPLLGPHILEASAGTGKTFSIEHIFVRLLLDPKEIELEEILVVTFTRAATRELKNRIRTNIEKAISFLESGCISWNYLNAIEDRNRAIRILSDAIGLFDRAQIFTIHGFCYRMLKEFAFEANLGFSLTHPDQEEAVPIRVWRASLKFLKEGVDPSLLCPEQMGILLKKYDSLNELAEALLIREDAAYLSFGKLQQLYREVLSRWTGEPIEKEKLLEDFQKIAPNYKIAVKGDFERQILSIANSFEFQEESLYFRELLREQGSIFKFISISNRRVKFSDPGSLHYPLFFSWSIENIAPLIELAIEPKNIMGALKQGWNQIGDPILLEEEHFSPDEILVQMEKAVDRECFADRVRNKYKAVIVDEFQDTDPIQWKIFQSLFLKKPDALAAFYLVGDPKQSIYRFRKADVYTYFQAREFLGEDSLYRLDTNFRSSKNLIGALNALFSRQWLPLPKLKQTIPSLPVLAGLDLISSFKDEKGAIHFLLAEGSNSLFEDVFLPFAISEIEKLADKTSSFSSYAILVKDRHQARAALELAQERNIPAVAKSHTPLGETFAFESLFELFKAIASPKNLASQRIVQSGPFHAFPLRDGYFLLEEKGLAPFFQKLTSDFLDSEFEKDLRQLIEELLLWEGLEGFSFPGLFRFLKNFKTLDPSEGGRRRMEVDANAVQILTMHVSKGLEFDVVFALGVASRPPLNEEEEEIDAEKLRQLYVAMTRAKLRLYVPIPLSYKQDARKGMSPVESFIEILEAQEGALVSFLQTLSEKESVSFENLPQPFILPPIKYTKKTLDEKKESIKVPFFQRSSLLSFTSLAQTTVEFEQLKEVHSSCPEQFTAHTMPKGKETGIFIHQIFEHLFSCSEPIWRNWEGVKKLVAQEIQESSLKPWEEAIANMIWNTLVHPLEPGFSLFDLEPENIQTEMEFLFAAPPDFVKGFIDLVFYFGGKYYIVDWKTNWLGSDLASYDSLNEVMTAHDYPLQASLYSEALSRHVKQFDMRPFSDLFGGVFYVFIRGPAVCHFIPDLNLIERVIHGT